MPSCLGFFTVSQGTLDVLKHVGLRVLAMHFVQHEFDVFPLSDFVETVARVVVDAACCALVGQKGEEFLEEAFSNLRGC
jgi:hypothetical protein